MKPLPKSIDETQALLAAGDYVADRSLATSLFLSLAMQRPLFLEGEAGVGKTEIAKVIAQALGRELIRLHCYEGLDIAQAAYEWNYSRQMVEIRLAEAAGERDKDRLTADIYAEKFLVKRPLHRQRQEERRRQAAVGDIVAGREQGLRLVDRLGKGSHAGHPEFCGICAGPASMFRRQRHAGCSAKAVTYKEPAWKPRC